MLNKLKQKQMKTNKKYRGKIKLINNISCNSFGFNISQGMLVEFTGYWISGFFIVDWIDEVYTDEQKEMMLSAEEDKRVETIMASHTN